MKTRLRIHRELVPILNKPGRFAIVSQYTEGGALHHDSNEGPKDKPGTGPGYSEDEALKKIAPIVEITTQP